MTYLRSALRFLPLPRWLGAVSSWASIITLVILAPLSALAQTAPSASPAIGIACAYNTSLPVIASGTAGWVQCDSSGRLIISNPGGGGGGGAIVPTSSSLSPTEVAVPAATSTQLLAANGSRKFLSLTNDGTSPCRVNYGAAATATNGEPLNGASAASGQGGNRTFDASIITPQAVFAYCASAGSFAVLEGQ